jgi:uncharacterized membrane protein
MTESRDPLAAVLVLALMISLSCVKTWQLATVNDSYGDESSGDFVGAKAMAIASKLWLLVMWDEVYMVTRAAIRIPSPHP